MYLSPCTPLWSAPILCDILVAWHCPIPLRHCSCCTGDQNQGESGSGSGWCGPSTPHPGRTPPHLALQAQVQQFGPKLLQLLAEWMETFPRDFQEDSTIRHVKDVVGRIAPCDEVGEPGSLSLCLGAEPVSETTSGPLSPHLFTAAALTSAPFCPMRKSAPGLVSCPPSCPAVISGPRWQEREDPLMGSCACMVRPLVCDPLGWPGRAFLGLVSQRPLLLALYHTRAKLAVSAPG